MEDLKPSMLVVDDDPCNRKLLAGYLRAGGYRVRYAEDGRTALALAREEPPDVVLLDVMMPGMTGYEVCAELKGDPRTRLSQIMLVTALDSTPDKVAGLDTGADDYVCKPVRREEFLAKVRTLLRARGLLLDLERARSELEERNRELQLKKTLAQTLVHDLKSPLTTVLGNLDLADMRCKGREELSEPLRRGRENGRRMLKMILDLLDVEGIEDGQLEPEFDRLDATEIVSASVEDAQLSARQKDVILALEAPERLELRADPDLMRRVLDNLVANALRNTPQGKSVRVEVSLQAEGVEIVVSDEGPGIPVEHREQVFDKYGQTELRQRGSRLNRGLGLTFCRLALEAHGGKIHVDSSASGGASFHAWLPQLQEDRGAPVATVLAGAV